jgi:hypothetical protein
MRFSNLRKNFAGGGTGSIKLGDFYLDSPLSLVGGAFDMPRKGQIVSLSRYRNKYKPPLITNGMTFWLDAHDATLNVDGGGAINSVTSLIGGHVLTPVNIAAKPQIVSGAGRERSYIRFDAAASGLITSANISWGSKWNVLYIINPHSSTAGGMYLLNVGLDRSNFVNDYVYVPGGADYNARGDTQTFDVNADFGFETAGDFNVRFLNYPTGPRYNGSARTKSAFYPTNTSTAAASAPLHLCYKSSGGNTQANFAEVMVFNRDLALDEIQILEGYMAWKWGIQSKLPVGHPYVGAPPGMPLPVFELIFRRAGEAISVDNVGVALVASTPSAPSIIDVGGTRGVVMNNHGARFYYSASSFSLGASYTKMAWLYYISGGSNGNILSSHNTSGAIHYFWFANNTQLSAGHGTNINAYVTDPVATPVNAWTHYVLTYDNPTTTMRLYRNGTLVATTVNAAMSWSGSTTQLGVGEFAGANLGNFYFDNMRIYNQVLTANQVQFIYDTEK